VEALALPGHSIRQYLQHGAGKATGLQVGAGGPPLRKQTSRLIHEPFLVLHAIPRHGVGGRVNYAAVVTISARLSTTISMPRSLGPGRRYSPSAFALNQKSGSRSRVSGWRRPGKYLPRQEGVLLSFSLGVTDLGRFSSCLQRLKLGAPARLLGRRKGD